MSRSQNSAWSPQDIPALTLGDDAIRLDIGYLGGDEHRRAFATIFAKLIDDNRAVFDPLQLVRIDARRELTPRVSPLSTLPISMVDVARFAFELGLDLYDSHNKAMLLVLNGPSGRRELGVRFDDPEFWLT
jgi:hypothetical protein